MSSASSVALDSPSCTTVSSSASSYSPPQSRGSEHTTFYDLEDMIQSPGAESVRTYTLIALLKVAENVHRANMSKDTIAANAILHPSWKGWKSLPGKQKDW